MTAYNDLAWLVRFRPLSSPLPAPTFDGYASSPFTASWSMTVDLLAKEIAHLNPREAIIELDLARGELDLRQDGMPRAQARTNSEGVVLSLLGSTQGDLRYPSSTFRDWKANVRAIALALEALRKVDRYGVTKRGEQYAGWKQLPSAGASTQSRGELLIREHGGVRDALKATHPDRGGDNDDFLAVQAAIQAGTHS